MNASDFSNTVVLTGAGFTANFGGLLANQIWSKIFNNPRLEAPSKIKEDLRNEFNFERIYSRCYNYIPKYGKLFKSGNYPDEEVTLFTQCLTQAFKQMDDHINDHSKSRIIQTNKVKNFLTEIMKNRSEKLLGYFTLNQDTLPENNFGWLPYGPINYQRVVSSTYVTDHGVLLPQDFSHFQDYVPINNVCYFKLHGSVDWFTQEKEDAMVIGFNKKEIIQNIALLNWYFTIFERAINRVGVRLIVIGYSFRDEHINKCILSAINNSNIRLVFINPSNPEVFIKKNFEDNDFISTDEKSLIWEHTEKYIPIKLSDTFTNNKTISPEHLDLRFTFLMDSL